jgi:hypothetical protein
VAVHIALPGKSSYLQPVNVLFDAYWWVMMWITKENEK